MLHICTHILFDQSGRGRPAGGDSMHTDGDFSARGRGRDAPRGGDHSARPLMRWGQPHLVPPPWRAAAAHSRRAPFVAARAGAEAGRAGMCLCKPVAATAWALFHRASPRVYSKEIPAVSEGWAALAASHVPWAGGDGLGNGRGRSDSRQRSCSFRSWPSGPGRDGSGERVHPTCRTSRVPLRAAPATSRAGLSLQAREADAGRDTGRAAQTDDEAGASRWALR